jgi:hypothetical protein
MTSRSSFFSRQDNFSAGIEKPKEVFFRKKIPFLLFLGFFLLNFAPVHGQYSKTEIRAAMIMKFAQFTKWPKEAFEPYHEKITLGIIGKDPFGSQIDLIFKGRQTHGRFWQIRRVEKIKDLWGCHVVFVANSEKEKNRFKDILDFCRKHDLLIVGDNIENFCAYGGTINFISNDGYHFEMNIETARSRKIVIDPNLMKLAKRIVAPTYGEE